MKRTNKTATSRDRTGRKVHTSSAAPAAPPPVPGNSINPSGKWKTSNTSSSSQRFATSSRESSRPTPTRKTSAGAHSQMRTSRSAAVESNARVTEGNSPTYSPIVSGTTTTIDTTAAHSDHERTSGSAVSGSTHTGKLTQIFANEETDEEGYACTDEEDVSPEPQPSKVKPIKREKSSEGTLIGQYRVVKVIGRGMYGTAMLVEDTKQDNAKYVMKQIRK